MGPSGGSAPQGAYGGGGGFGQPANVYTPAQQQSADSLYQAILGGVASSLFPGSVQFPGSSTQGNPYLSFGEFGGTGVGTPTLASSSPFFAPTAGAGRGGSFFPPTAGAGVSGTTGTLGAGALGGQNLYGTGIDPSLFAGFGSALPLGFSVAQTPAGQAYPAAQAIFNQYLNPLAQGTAGAALTGQAETLAGQGMAGAGQIYNQAFDPQQALYNQIANQSGQQAAAALANTGTLGTPYGGATLANAANNLNLNWQNQLLNRMATGGPAAGQMAAGALQLGQAPGTTGINALNNLANLGTSAYQLPQQVLNDLQSYLGLGQSASQISGQLGNLGVQQQLAQQAAQQQMLSGLGSGLGGIGSVASGLGGLFGGGAAGAGAGAADVLGGSALGAGFGGGSAALDALPAMALS